MQQRGRNNVDSNVQGLTLCHEALIFKYMIRLEPEQLADSSYGVPELRL